MKKQHFSIIFDTNELFDNYDKKADFTEFYFNSTFSNILDKIEEKDICEFIYVAIPKVVWSELKEQKIEKYEQKKEDYKNTIRKFKFPNIKVDIGEEINYEEYLDKKMLQYEKRIHNRQAQVKTLELPNNDRLPKIIERAYKKKPPFGGKEKNSDKGFKDVLLWESVIEYKTQNKNEKIILYTNDNIFNDEIKEEYKKLFDNEEIIIARNELEIISILDEILNTNIPDAKTLKDNAKSEYEDILNYIKGKEFSLEIMEKLNNINIFSDIFSIEDFRLKEILSIVYEQISNNEYEIYNIKIKGVIYLKKYSENLEDIFEQEKILNIIIKKSKENIIIENIDMEKTI